MLIGGPVQAGSLGVEPSAAISAQYDSNPFLLVSHAAAAESGAVNFDLPTTYTGEVQSFALTPRLRFAQSAGAVALLSNYEYLDGSWKLGLERNTLSASGSWHHDSTFYNQFENAALSGRTVNRTERSGDLDWQWQLDELSDVRLGGSFDQVGYGANGAGILASFKYSQAQAQFDRSLSERWQWSLIAGYGYYELPGSSYRSANEFAQTSLRRLLSQRWSLTVQVGYAYVRADSRVPQYFCCTILPSGSLGFYVRSVIDDAARGTPNYALTLERRYQRLVLDLSASRVIQPTGFGALLAQTDVSLHGSYALTERWKLGATLHGSQLSDTLGQLDLGNRRYYDLDLTAAWRWTPLWTLQLQTSFDLQRINAVQAHRAQVYLSLRRQFGRFSL
jgi:hypothetical protein